MLSTTALARFFKNILYTRHLNVQYTFLHYAYVSLFVLVLCLFICFKRSTVVIFSNMPEGTRKRKFYFFLQHINLMRLSSLEVYHDQISKAGH